MLILGEFITSFIVVEFYTNRQSSPLSITTHPWSSDGDPCGGEHAEIYFIPAKRDKDGQKLNITVGIIYFLSPVRLALASRYAATLRKKTETARPVSRQSVLFAHLRLLAIRYYKQFSKIQYLTLEFFLNFYPTTLVMERSGK